MNILQRQKPTPNPPPNSNPDQQKEQQKQQLPPQCVDTKLIIWQDDQFQQFDVDFLNQIYPQKINKDTVSKGCQFIFHFLSSSLYYWVEFKDSQQGGVQGQKQKLSYKDWKFIQGLLNQQNCDNARNYNRWGKNFLKKQQFHKKQVQQSKFTVPKGEVVHQYKRVQDQYVVQRYSGNNKQFIPYKKRFQILFLFYIDGVSFIDQQIQEWEYFVIYKKKQQSRRIFVGVLSKFIFKLTSVKERHRISQVFIMPSYQKHGHGKQLLDLIYKRSLQSKNCFEITTEVPSYEYQCLRDYKQLQLILNHKIINIQSLPQISTKKDIQITQQDHLLTKQTLRSIKQQIKLPGNQIQRLIHILIFAKIQSQADNQMAIAHFQQFLRQKIIFNRSAFKSRRKVPQITFQGECSDMKQFFIEKAKQDYIKNQDDIQQVLTETIDGFKRVTAKLIKNKLINFI